MINLLVWCLAAWLVRAHADSFTQEFTEAVRHAQIYNTSARKNDEVVLTEADREPLPAVWRWVDRARVSMFAADKTDLIYKQYFAEKMGKILVPVYPRAGRFEADLPTDFAQGEMRRVLSRKTFAYFADGAQTFLKYSRSDEKQDAALARTSTEFTRFVRGVRKFAGGHPSWDVFEEPFALHVGPANTRDVKGYCVTVRPLDAYRSAYRARTHLYALHEFFGDPALVAKTAASASLSVVDWFRQIYLPRFAEALAETHFVHGLFFAAHTQNTLMTVDPGDGTISRFWFRDFPDALVDPLPMMAAGLEPESLTALGARGINVAFTSYVDQEYPRAREPAENFRLFTLQSILQVDQPVAPLEALQIFFTRYRAAIEERLGEKINLDDEGEFTWQTFLRAQSAEEIEARWSALGRLDIAAAKLVEHLHAGVRQRNMNVLSAKLKGLPLEYLTYERLTLLRRLNRNGQLFFTNEANRSLLIKDLSRGWLSKVTHPFSRTSLRLVFDGGQTYAINPYTFEVIAFTLPDTACAAQLEPG